MILQELYRYYQRLLDDPESGVAPPGFSREKISFALTLDLNGNLVGEKVMDLRDEKKKAKMTVVPQAVKGKVGFAILPNFTWDNNSYVLGADLKGKPERSQELFEAFRQYHHDLCDTCSEPAVQAMLLFLDSWEPEKMESLPHWEDIVKGANLCFVLQSGGALVYVHELPAVKRIWLKRFGEQLSDVLGQCLITGQTNVPIARLHPQMSGVKGASVMGATIVGFKQPSFMSFGKDKSFNAPVSEEAANAYTLMLNQLLATDSKQKFFLGDTSIVFWAEKKDKVEEIIALIFNPPMEDEERTVEAKDVERNILHVLREARHGVLSRAVLKEISDDPDVRIFVLGLAPNAARISVRFWETMSLERLVANVGRHYADIELVRSERDREFFPVEFILRETAAQHKWENIPPLLGGELMRAVLNAADYPMAIYSALLTRIRADRTVNHIRAAMLKGVLVRNFPNPNKEIVTMSLNTATTDTAYRLGRLFAVLESLQYKAVNPQATIKDRFFGAASATPAGVFPNLLRNAQNHIGKIGWGDQPIQEILSGVDEFPAHLDMQQQGRFILGYYHQRQQNFEDIAARKQAKETTEE